MKFKRENIKKLNIKYACFTQIQQHSNVKYLRCLSNETVSAEGTALKMNKSVYIAKSRQQVL